MAVLSYSRSMQSAYYYHEPAEPSAERDKLFGKIEQQFRYASRATDWNDSRKFVAQALRLAAQGYRSHVVDEDDIVDALAPIEKEFRRIDEPALNRLRETLWDLGEAYSWSQEFVDTMIADLDAMADAILGSGTSGQPITDERDHQDL